jgi:hypothetical protein
MSKYQNIINAVDDLVSDFIYDNRKEDEDLPEGAIEKAIANGDITEYEIVDKFKHSLRAGLQ